MNGKKILLDSNVIINASRNDINSLEIIQNESNELFISIITYVEVLGFAFNSDEDESLLKKILGMFTIINLDFDIAEQTIQYRKLKKIKLPDAFILATAKVLNLTFCTFDSEDYSKIESSVEIIKLHG